MSVISMYKQFKETTKATRELNTKTLKSVMDDLMNTEYTEDQRKQLADSAKSLLDTNANLESTNGEVEFHAGRIRGMFDALEAAVIGFAVGRGICYVIDKLMTK